MTRQDQTTPFAADSTHIEEIIARCTAPIQLAGGRRDGLGLIEILRQYPELATNRSFIIEKAIQGYGQLTHGSSPLSLDEYCERFAPLGASLQSSIYRQLEVELFLDRHPALKSQLKANVWPSPGDSCGSFRVIEEVGRGALARVYLCSQPALGNRQVIVKISDSSVLEADVLGRLRHQHIVPILSAETDAQRNMMMLCMPFLGRSTLHDLFDISRAGGLHKPLSLISRAASIWEQPTDSIDDCARHTALPQLGSFHDCVLYIGASLAGALAHAHEKGIVHGDIKPSNVLLAKSGMPLLMDFNLSGNSAHAIVPRGGTLPYMPPEQVRAVAIQNNRVARYDQRSDIFSLGVLMYEALSGRLPFPLNNVTEVTQGVAQDLLNRQRDGCVPLRSVDKTISPTLAAAVEKCLSFDPSGRYQSANQLCGCLNAELRPYRRFQRRISAHPRSSVVAGTTLTVSLGAAVVYFLFRPPLHVRLTSAATELRDAGRLAVAEDTLQQALAINPSYNEARFELGRAYLQRKEVKRARESFYKLALAERSPRSAAYLAYCFSLEGNPTSSIVWYERAIEWGATAPEVYNNLAFSYASGGSRYGTHEALTKAEACLKTALQKAPHDPTVRLNWICLAVEKAELLDHSVDAETLRLCRELTSAYPDCGLLLGRVAMAFASASVHVPELQSEGVQFLERAVAQGHGDPPDKLVESRRWASFQDNHRFQQLVAAAKADQITPRNGTRLTRVLEPISLVNRNMAH
jgi:serine/threonine protein kinase/Flp pilus assembly protein TadD